MSSTSTSPERIGADKIILGAVALVLIVALSFVFSQRQQSLRSSASGLDGLPVWLSSEGLDAQNFLGNWPVPAEEIGFLIVPLYDTDLDAEREAPRTEEDLIAQTDEYDLSWSPLWDKTDLVPTMVVLPKWRSGMRLTKLAHPALVVPGENVEELGQRLVSAGRFELSYAASPFSEYAYDAQDGERLGATLYAAQTFSSDRCRPLVGTEEAMIVGDCQRVKRDASDRILVVSDPDLLNNHGLTLGDNAFIIRDIVQTYAEGKRVLVDYSRINWLTTETGRSERERSWSDLLRFLDPPFTLIWFGAVAAFLLVLWRAGLRFGPPAPSLQGRGASKALAIAARARLMLLSGRAGAMVEDYLRARLASTASHIFGAAHAQSLSSPEAFLAYAKRRHPEHAGRLAEILNTIHSLPDEASARHAMDVIDTLDTILETITHDTRSAQHAR